jgi:hypothetical protein
MYRRFAPLVFVLALGIGAPAAAQEVVSESTKAAEVATPGIAEYLKASQVPVPAAVTPAAPVPSVLTAKRPGALMPLYVSFGALQAMDVHSTTRALNRGAVEANPLMKNVAGNPYALSAVKLAGSATAIYAAEKMWKKNKKAAVIFMIAANAGMAFIVQHNYRAVR